MIYYSHIYHTEQWQIIFLSRLNVMAVHIKTMCFWNVTSSASVNRFHFTENLEPPSAHCTKSHTVKFQKSTISIICIYKQCFFYSVKQYALTIFLPSFQIEGRLKTSLKLFLQTEHTSFLIKNINCRPLLLSKIKLVHTLPYYFKIHFNIIHPSLPNSLFISGFLLAFHLLMLSTTKTIQWQCQREKC